MRRSLPFVIVALGIGGLLVAVVLSTRSEAPIAASLDLAEAMGGDTTGYARATAIRAFRFPDDHGPHPAFKTEWWYVTGNLSAGAARRFGFQFTLFRVALTPTGTLRRTSDWASNQLYMGHFTVTDVDGARFYADERFSRGAAGLAGAEGQPFRVWLEDWAVTAATPTSTVPPFRVVAAGAGAAVDLVMAPLKPLVLQGDRGLDPKGDEPGNASYYYSFTRLATEGTIVVEGETFAVEGLSWMDREWSTSALGADQVGWDWFALQLDDGRDLMFYQLRRRDGTPSPQTSGVLVGADGEKTPLAQADVNLAVTDTWTSPEGTTYPAGWRLQIPAHGLDLRVTPLLANQELDVSVRYWEGAVAVEGTARERSVSGQGYVELTGYAGTVGALER